MIANDLLLKGDFRGAYRAARRAMKLDPLNINDFITASLCVPQSKVSPSTTSPVRQLLNGIAIIISKQRDFERATSETLRVTRNFSFLPSMKALRQVAELESFPRNSGMDQKLRLKILNGRYFDPRDFLNSFDIAERDHLLPIIRNYVGPMADLVAWLLNAEDQFDAEDINPEVLRAAQSITKLGSQPSLHREGIDELETLVRDMGIYRPLRIYLALFLAGELIKRNDLGTAVDLIAREFVVEPAVERALPVADAIGPDGWRALRPYAKQISVPIILDLRSRETNDDKIATYRRFATNQFLAKNILERPSDIRSHMAKFPKSELIYFLYNICVSSVIDMLTVFQSSQELNEERQKICAALIELDPDSSDKYQDEILQIRHRMVLELGLKLVDSSRVHVDSDGIKRWAKRELEENFFRYRSLLDAGIGIADNFDDFMRKLSKIEGINAYLVLPNTEADEILIRMVSALLDRFLFDTSFGLDSYLSQRIRHGSIQNYLRSPVEQLHLVTQKDFKQANTNLITIGPRN